MAITPLENGATTVPTISGRGRLVRLVHLAGVRKVVQRLHGGHFEAVVWQIEVEGGIQFPNFQNHLDGFRKHLVAVFIKNAQGLGIRGQ